MYKIQTWLELKCGTFDKVRVENDVQNRTCLVLKSRYFRLGWDFARFCMILRDSAKLCRIWQYSAKFCKILQDSARFCEILRDSARFYEVRRGSGIFCEFVLDSVNG